MDGEIEDIGVGREFAVQNAQEFQGRVRLVGKHCAAHACHGGISMGRLGSAGCNALFQERQGFFAMAVFRKGEGVLGGIGFSFLAAWGNA